MTQMNALMASTTDLDTVTWLRRTLSEGAWNVRMCIADMDYDSSWHKDHPCRTKLMETARRLLAASAPYPTAVKAAHTPAGIKRPYESINYSDAASKRRVCYNAVKQIQCKTGWYVDYVELTYEDGSSEGYGNHEKGTSMKCEALKVGETIIEAEQQGWSYGYLGSALIFRLSTGREIKLHGLSGQKKLKGG